MNFNIHGTVIHNLGTLLQVLSSLFLMVSQKERLRKRCRKELHVKKLI